MKHREDRMRDASADEGKKVAIMSFRLNILRTAVKFLLYIFTGIPSHLERLYSP